jgi:Tfp pilus assembly protein FimT
MTLAELLLVLALSSILMTAGTLQVSRFLASIRLPLAARQLASDLHVARATAVSRNTRAQVAFADGRYSIRYDSGDPREVHATFDRTIRIVAVPRAGILRFFSTGYADNGTIVLATASGGRRSVVVNQRGRIVVR